MVWVQYHGSVLALFSWRWVHWLRDVTLTHTAKENLSQRLIEQLDQFAMVYLVKSHWC